MKPAPSILRVAHVLRKYDPDEWGGTETHVVELTRHLQTTGVQSCVYAPSGPATEDRALAHGIPLVRYRAFLPFVGTADKRRGLVANAGNIASFDAPLRLAADKSLTLAHLHTGRRIGGAVRTAMLLTGRPYVVSLHGPLFADAEQVRASLAGRMNGTLDLGKPLGALFGARRVIDDAARVLTFNRAEWRALEARIGRRAELLDQGVDVARIESGDARRADSRWPRLAGHPVIAVIGRVCEQKNQLLAVAAFARGAPMDHHLVLAGAETDPGYAQRVETLASELGVGARVHMLGNLDAKVEVPDLLSRADIVLVPSTHETFGLAVLEAWAASKPTFFARVSALSDLAEAAGRPESALASLEIDEWASALHRACIDGALRRRLGARGRDQVNKRYRWEHVAERVAGVYADVMRSPESR